MEGVQPQKKNEISFMKNFSFTFFDNSKKQKEKKTEWNIFQMAGLELRVYSPDSLRVCLGMVCAK